MINKADQLYQEAAEGFHLIPNQYRIAIQLASALYQ
jgi:hypothetical protein